MSLTAELSKASKADLIKRIIVQRDIIADLKPQTSAQKSLLRHISSLPEKELVSRVLLMVDIIEEVERFTTLYDLLEEKIQAIANDQEYLRSTFFGLSSETKELKRTFKDAVKRKDEQLDQLLRKINKLKAKKVRKVET